MFNGGLHPKPLHYRHLLDYSPAMLLRFISFGLFLHHILLIRPVIIKKLHIFILFCPSTPLCSMLSLADILIYVITDCGLNCCCKVCCYFRFHPSWVLLLRSKQLKRFIPPPAGWERKYQTISCSL